jgi:hypothetical protein
MRRLLISAAIPALAAGVFALPAVSASAAPPPSCAVLPGSCHPHHGPLPKGLANAANLNPQPLPPGRTIYPRTADGPASW